MTSLHSTINLNRTHQLLYASFLTLRLGIRILDFKRRLFFRRKYQKSWELPASRNHVGQERHILST